MFHWLRFLCFLSTHVFTDENKKLSCTISKFNFSSIERGTQILTILLPANNTYKKKHISPRCRIANTVENLRLDISW